jgi:predicted nucleotidyltransferase
MMLEKALSSKTGIRLLKIFHRFPGRVFSLSDITKITGQSTGAVYPALARLVDAGLIKSSRMGKSTTYRLNTDNLLSRKVMEIFTAESAILRKAAEEFAAKMPKKGVISIILFGSVARGEPNEKSDVDLLIVYKESRLSVERSANIIAEESLKSDVYISLVFYSQGEIKDMALKYNSFITRIENEGIPLYGKRLEAIYGKKTG